MNVLYQLSISNGLPAVTGQCCLEEWLSADMVPSHFLKFSSNNYFDTKHSWEKCVLYEIHQFEILKKESWVTLLYLVFPKTCWVLPSSHTYNIEAKVLKFCCMQQSLGLLHTTKFQASSFNIVRVRAGESPQCFRISLLK